MAATIHTSSPAVRRTLEALASLAGPADVTLIHEGTALRIERAGVELHTLPSPIRTAELLRILRSAQGPALQGGWQLDTTGRQLTLGTDSHALTEKETLLLTTLLAAYPEPASRDTLLKEVWGLASDIETHTLETHIYRLRHKLEGLSPRPCDIITTGSAYQMVLEGA